MLNLFRRLYTNELGINFVKYQNFNFAISTVLTCVVLLFILFFGINLGIDFTGGLVIEARSKQLINTTWVQEKLSEAGLEAFIVHNLGDNYGVLIKIKSTKSEDVDKIKNIFKEYGFEYNKVEFVGPQFGKELIINGLVAIVLSFLGVFIYLWIRFNWKFAIAGILGLFHDFIICFVVFIFSDFEFNVSSVAALLTVIGYSINDSVVIFDRIREKMFKIKDVSKLINSSINSTIFRSIFTSFTTLVALLPIIIFCSGEIKSFAIVVFVGVFIGTYSSIFISSLVINVMLQQKGKHVVLGQ